MMDSDREDPYCTILSICSSSFSSFQLPATGKLQVPPPPQPPPTESETEILGGGGGGEYPLFGPIPDHLLPHYLCLTPESPTPSSPLATTFSTSAAHQNHNANTDINTSCYGVDLVSTNHNSATTISPLHDYHSHPNTSINDAHTHTHALPPSPDTFHQVSIFIANDSPAMHTDRIPIICRQKYQNPNPISIPKTPLPCVLSHQNSVSSTPEPDSSHFQTYRYQMGMGVDQDRYRRISSMLLSQLKYIAVSSHLIPCCAPEDFDVMHFVAAFRDSAFVLQSQPPSYSWYLLRSDGDRSKLKKRSSLPSNYNYITRSRAAKSVDGNSGHFVSLSDDPSTSFRKTHKANNLSRSESHWNPIDHHPNNNAEIGDGFGCGPKKRLTLDYSESEPSLNKSNRTSSRSDHRGCFTTGAWKTNIATHREVESHHFSPHHVDFSTVVSRALKLIKSTNFELNDDNEEELKLWAT